jgi:hypothetical protein
VLLTPALSLALTVTCGLLARPLTHCPLASGPASEIDGGTGSSIVTSTTCECIVAPGGHVAAPQMTSWWIAVVPSGAPKVSGQPRLSNPFE